MQCTIVPHSYQNKSAQTADENPLILYIITLLLSADTTVSTTLPSYIHERYGVLIFYLDILGFYRSNLF